MGTVDRARDLAGPPLEADLRILKLENRLQRERAARLHAEEIAERGLRDLYERQRQLELLAAIATKANHGRSVDETLRFALDRICAHTGWPFGNVYMIEAGTGQLCPTKLWHAVDQDRFAPFIETTQGLVLTRGVGLPGQVLASGEAVWIDDFANDATLPRAEAAAACGLHAAFAFPILVGSDVVAIMEFFDRSRQAPDEHLLAIMSQIGTQLGRVLERRVSEDKLIYDATHDPLTNLPNRALFTDRLGRAVAIKRMRPQNDYAVIFIDLDRFKLVNDSLGHGAGDVLLVDIARRLQAVIDEEVPQTGERVLATLARLGGDEFTVLLEGGVRTDIALDCAKRIQEALRQPVTIGRQKVYSSASIGIAFSTTDYQSADEIMRDADLAMYRAKGSGRGRIEIFDQSLHQHAVERLELESDLREALNNGEFLLHYQPIVTLDGGTITGFEALVRWRRRSTGKLVPPGEFINLAEETGLIVFIGAWIMREAFSALVSWQESFPATAGLTMSVNVSPRQFHQPDFVQTVVGAMTETGIDPSNVRLEITESVPIADAERTLAILNELRALGVRISIDDFGTGYSSLSYLHKLPFDVLKIDRSFIASLKEQQSGLEIIQTILELARSMGMDVIAEGAETALHVDTLRELGCQFAQGYYFSRPVGEREIRGLLGKLRAEKAGEAA